MWLPLYQGIIMEIMASVFIAAVIGAVIMWYYDRWRGL
jgi:hypothetical protein